MVLQEIQMTCEASIACSFVPMVLVKTMCLVVCIQVDDCIVRVIYVWQ